MAQEQVLKQFETLPGVWGAALLTRDGVLVASNFKDVDSETLVALSSQFLHQMEQSSKSSGLPSFRHLCLKALQGSLFFVCLEDVVLVVAAKATQEPSELWPRIESAFSALPRMSGV